MTLRVILASLASAVLMFFWGFLYWGVLATSISPWTPLESGGRSELASSLQETLPESGVYMYPWVDASVGDSPELEEKFQKQHEAGPFVQIFYQAEGTTPAAMQTMMIRGFCHMLISSMLCCVLLVLTEPCESYGGRLGFVFGLGALGTFWSEGGDFVWWRHPGSHVLFMSAYDLASWLLAGLVIAALVKKNDSAPNTSLQQ